MNLPFALPDWLPDWAFLLLAIPALLFAMAFLLMPFSVFGVKARLEAIEAQMDALTEELRNAGPAGPAGRGFAGRDFTDAADGFDLPNFGRAKSRLANSPAPPAFAPTPASPVPVPVPAPAPAPLPRPAEKPATRRPPGPSRRSEPRLD